MNIGSQSDILIKITHLQIHVAHWLAECSYSQDAVTQNCDKCLYVFLWTHTGNGLSTYTFMTFMLGFQSCWYTADEGLGFLTPKQLLLWTRILCGAMYWSHWLDGCIRTKLHSVWEYSCVCVHNWCCFSWKVPAGELPAVVEKRANCVYM